MGVYHLMGLGRSLGTVTGPVSYLAMRYQRWNKDDQEFFSLSGEAAQREKGEKVGDIESLVLFTSREVRNGEMDCYEFIDNRPGHCAPPATLSKQKMPDALRRYLPAEWKPVAKQRSEGRLFWCDVHRGDLLSTFERVSRVLGALKSTGSLGKEMWINLTGGNNVINLSLELAATLGRYPARFYYVQGEGVAGKCIRYTREEGYWVDLPLLTVSPDHLGRFVVEEVERLGGTNCGDLFSRMKQAHSQEMQEVDGVEHFRRLVVRPLLNQGILKQLAGANVGVGGTWHLLKQYYSAIDELESQPPNVEGLSKEGWFSEDRIVL